MEQRWLTGSKWHLARSKWKLACILVACLLLFSGIAGCGEGEGEKVAEGKIFLGGTNGISADFILGEPEDLVYKDQMFDIGISLKNNGEFDSRKIIVSLFGLNQESFSLASLDKQMISDELEGRDIDYPELDVIEEEVIFSARYKEDIKADFKPTIKANVCYVYGSYAVADVCLKRDVFSKDEEDSCFVGDVLNFDGSSAPVKISGVELRPAGKNELKMIFTIENLGSGDVYLNDAFESSCRGEGHKKDKVLVSIEPTTIVPIKCSKLSENGVASLISGKRTVSCDIDTSDLQNVAFSERINFNLYYFYKESLSKSVTIVA